MLDIPDSALRYLAVVGIFVLVPLMVKLIYNRFRHNEYRFQESAFTTTVLFISLISVKLVQSASHDHRIPAMAVIAGIALAVGLLDRRFRPKPQSESLPPLPRQLRPPLPSERLYLSPDGDSHR